MLDILISPFARIIGVIVLVGALFGAGYYKGYSGEKERFDTFKSDLQAQVKAQEAVNAVTALSAQVATLIAALRKQITTLTNLVIKIQKKVRA